MAYKPDFIKKLPAPLQAPAGELFEWGRSSVEDRLKEEIGINEPDVFKRAEGSLPTSYWDSHNAAKTKEQLLYIQHLASKKTVGLYAMMTSLSNNYNITWANEDVYGRADPIPGYTNTKRTINLTFKIVSADLDEAKFNYEKTLGRGGCERVSLTNMFYPTYTEINGYKTIASPPLLAIKHMQLLQSYGRTVDGGFLVGWVSSATITPKFDEGSYEDAKEKKESEQEDMDYYYFIYPKVIEITFAFNVMHDYDLGFKASTGFLAELFPEIGSGEDIGRFYGCKLGKGSDFQEEYAMIGGMLGGAADNFIDATVDYDNTAPNGGAAPGSPQAIGVLPALLNAGGKSIFGG